MSGTLRRASISCRQYFHSKNQHSNSLPSCHTSFTFIAPLQTTPGIHFTTPDYKKEYIHSLDEKLHPFHPINIASGHWHSSPTRHRKVSIDARIYAQRGFTLIDFIDTLVISSRPICLGAYCESHTKSWHFPPTEYTNRLRSNDIAHNFGKSS